MSNFNLVEEFMTTFGQEVKIKAEWPNEDVCDLRVDLISEELNNRIYHLSFPLKTNDRVFRHH